MVSRQEASQLNPKAKAWTPSEVPSSEDVSLSDAYAAFLAAVRSRISGAEANLEALSRAVIPRVDLAAMDRIVGLTQDEGHAFVGCVADHGAYRGVDARHKRRRDLIKTMRAKGPKHRLRFDDSPK